MNSYNLYGKREDHYKHDYRVFIWWGNLFILRLLMYNSYKCHPNNIKNKISYELKILQLPNQTAAEWTNQNN